MSTPVDIGTRRAAATYRTVDTCDTCEHYARGDVALWCDPSSYSAYGDMAALETHLDNDLHGAACVTCYVAIANGVSELDADDAAAYLAGVDRDGGGVWFTSHDGDAWFSWTPCDICRRPLGGDRYTVCCVDA